ncbi:MAG: Hpt domain-containing protein [Pseudomonadota bacterium]
MTTVAERLAAARRRYLASFPEKADALEDALSLSQTGPPGDETLRTLVHRLAGSAALHGLDDLAADARAAEALCESAPSPELETLIDRVVTHLRSHAGH